MFTINGEVKGYSELWVAIAAARTWMRTACRSAVIRKDGEIVRLLRY